MERIITHLDLDSFFVSAECLSKPELVGKPVIIGGKSERGVVASCSYEARKYGLHSAMPIKQALRLCPQAIVLSGNMKLYSELSQAVTTIIAEQAPLYEKSSIDEFYIDLSGMDRFYKIEHWMRNLSEAIRKNTGLPHSYGIGSSKLLAKVGTNQVKPAGSIRIPSGTEKAFLAPLAIRELPGIGKKTAEFLLQMGIGKVGTLAQMPPEVLEATFGKSGRDLWLRANGIDRSPVEPYSERKSISSERTFATDTTNSKMLKDVLTNMAEQLSYQLRSLSKLTACVAVKIRYADFRSEMKQQTIPYTGSDQPIIRAAHEILDKLYNRRVRVRLVGLRLSKLVRGNHQIDLFNDSLEEIKLEEAMDRIRHKFGKHAIGRATALKREER
ncbi:MAG: DNA polymerase IV [Cyclobacteriaceae bacterium]|nr:DNA polymerase IV [Cyclobacteriaceae bacterium]MCH8515468.1 DNA polymerase IV [Cyclobacteriaceae bacterium]